MSGNFLSDYINGKLQPIPPSGVINGILRYESSSEEEDYDSDSSVESGIEQHEYMEKELSSYYREPETVGGLTDIDDGHEESILGTEIMEQLHVPKTFEMYKFDTYCKSELPIDSYRTKILDMINTNSVVIIHGPTGCGKTTQVPQYIMDQCRATKSPCNIVVTQPRRIAAINIAQRVCEERGWAIGTVCGYQVGLDKNVGDQVILTYMTTEVLLQKLILQKNLNKYTHIVIDEVHERNKALDFLLLLVRKYLFTNSSSVKVILMSATMQAKEFAQYFRSVSRNDPRDYLLAPILHVTKKSQYTTNIYYIEQFLDGQIPHFNIDEPYIMEEQYEACWKLISLCDNFDKDTTTGSVLVFLPGYHEIEEMHNILLKKKLSALEWEIVPLHSSLTSDHMIKAFQKPKPGVRKIILSTNIAESSLTVPDVNYVVDFCLTKMMVVNETTKFSTLSLQWASHDNCIQRAGRVGRVANGRVYRLVPADFYNNQMQATSIPELQRAPLENIILYMKLLNLNDTPKNVLSLAISPPNFKDVEACVWHLKELGALLQTCRGVKSAADGDITFLGKIMGSLPIDIHLAKLVLLGHMFSCLEDTVIMAAGSMTRNLFVNNFHDRLKCYRKKLLWADGSCSDFITLLNLYKVWLNTKRENAFRTNNEAYAWCKTNFVNMRGLREWDLLINEINARLKRFGIERSAGVTNVQLSPVEKPTILKVIICGAFYPHYFVRSADYGQVDSREAVKMLNGRDPYNTVYLTNMKLHHPGQIYVREFKRLLNHENDPNVHIGFDGQSSKVFVEFKNVKRPERVTVDGKQYVTTILGNIAMDVYEAVRRRQLNLPLRLHVLPNHKAWQFVDSTESKRRLSISSSDEVNCYSAINYSPLPPLDIEYVTVTVTHIIDAGNFFCHNWSDETRILLSRIFAALNSGEVFLDPVEGKVKIETKMYAAVFDEDGKLYRCKVLCITPGEPPIAHVQFVDYGNTQKVHTNRLYELPKDSPECDVEPIAMRCVLSEVEPHRALDSKGLWSEKVNNIFRRRTDGVLLNAKVYSVVDNVAHLELFPKNPAPNVGSFNKWLINEGHAQPLQESQRSKMDHETRRKVLNSDDPNNLSALFKSVVEVSTSYTDFEAPERSEATEVVELKGPYSPLEMKVCGLVEASLGCTVRVDGDSVNAVLLDDDPEDDHARLLVAGQVAQSAQAKTIKVSQSTLMPNIPGLPMWMTLLFCPRMEPKLTEDGTRVASILCGLGCKEYSDRANFPMHDISLVVDTELQEETIVKINELRFLMNRAVKAMNNIYDALDNPEELFPIQKRLKEQMFSLLHTKPNTVNRVNVKHANCWKRGTCADVEIMRIDIEEEEDDIWPLLWFVKLKKDSHATAAIKNNLEELVQISKGLVQAKEIRCELCEVNLISVSDLRVHLFKDGHKTKLAKYLRDTK